MNLTDLRTVAIALLVSVGAASAAPQPITPGGKPGTIVKMDQESLRGRQIRDLQWQVKNLHRKLELVVAVVNCTPGMTPVTDQFGSTIGDVEQCTATP